MYLKYIKNDLENSKLSSAAMLVILTMAAFLLSISLLLCSSLFGSIDSLMERAESAHFMQMHAGSIDLERLQEFAEENEYVSAYETSEFLNIEGADIVFLSTGSSLEDSVQDHGLSVQNEKLDYLIDLNGKIVHPKQGEIYLPIYMKKTGLACLGDTVRICEKPFLVKGFVRDSQMNAELAMSKRLLVSKEDYEALKSQGAIEYLVGFRLKDMGQLHSFEQAYSRANLPANGPTLNFALFRMLNAIEDGIFIVILLLVSILATLVALLCIRFTILTKLEEDFHEIGVMKGIGMPAAAVRNLYLSKYAALAATGCMLGFLLSRVFQERLLADLQLYMGENRNSWTEILLTFGGVLLLFLFILVYLKHVLKKIDKVSAKQAINGEIQTEKSKGAGGMPLGSGRRLGASVFLAVKDVFSRKRLYSTICFIFIFLAFMMLVPQNLYHTIDAPGFVTYMGIGEYDMQMNIQQADSTPETIEEISRKLNADESVASHNVILTKVVAIQKEDGQIESMKVDLGDHTKFPVYYFTGHAPDGETEIALSSTNAEELQKQVGDTLRVSLPDGEKRLTVCGIYSDVTNGGRTAKASFTCPEIPPMRSLIAVDFADELSKSKMEQAVAYYAGQYQFAKVSGIQDYAQKLFGSTKQAVKQAADASLAVSVIIASMITMLFLKLLLTKDRESVKLLHFLGFAKNELKMQYAVRIVIVFLVGIAMGTLLANTFGEQLSGVLLSSLGISSFRFVIKPVNAYLLLPAGMLAAVMAAVWVVPVTVFGDSGKSSFN